MARKRVKPGDIFAIPLGDDMIAAGIALHISKYFKNGMLTGYFTECFPSIEAIDIADLRPEFAFTPNYTSKVMVGCGDWPLVGHSDALLAQSEIPILVTVTTLLYKDEVVDQLDSIEKTRGYTVLAGQGKGFVENRLRKYFDPRQPTSQPE
jgi:hypothetical protein